MSSKNNTTIPFLRWAGGKRWLIKHIDELLPPSILNYHEPFLGGGAIFVYLKTNNKIKDKSYLSDSNSQLINSYKQLKTNIEEVVQYLNTYKNDEEFYYRIRSSSPRNEIEAAAQFIFLNRTSFNGIYRVNRKGEYNVPYGNKDYKELFNYENFKSFKKILTKCNLRDQDFFESLKNIRTGDFIFIDPPYTVAHENNGFIKYNQKLFSWDDQIKLKEFLVELNKIGANFLMTNAAHISIKNLFEGVGSKLEISRASVIGGKGAKRTTYKEYIYKNY